MVLVLVLGVDVWGLFVLVKLLVYLLLDLVLEWVTGFAGFFVRIRGLVAGLGKLAWWKVGLV